MDHEKDYTEKIERYLDGEMDQSEEKTFKETITNTPELAKEVSLHQAIRFGIENQPLMMEGDPFGARAFAEEAKALRAKKKRINLRLRYAALAVAAVILVLILVYIPNQGPSYQELALDPFSAMRGADQAEQIRQIKEAYQEKQYADGLGQIDALLAQDNVDINYDALRYLQGCFYLEQAEYTKAIGVFDALVSENDDQNQYLMESHWQLGVAYGLSGDEEASNQAFQRLFQHPDLKSNQKKFYENRLGRKIE